MATEQPAEGCLIRTGPTSYQVGRDEPRVLLGTSLLSRLIADGAKPHPTPTPRAGGVGGAAPPEPEVRGQVQTVALLPSCSTGTTDGTVTVLYFARSAELTGLREEELVAVPTPISSAQVAKLRRSDQVAARRADGDSSCFCRLVALQGRVVLAVRRQYVTIGNQQLSLQDGDEVAVVPPLSGG
ncbi:hypothetical protein CCH79_00020559 [Gambusia affinis]|uniref:Molybdopterin synthase sulfur carrier subunit n=1 Tax=Gambusia affinis TaxID=33528 RepID=A0A315WEU0_GAMAF|nr:hypothetical protein CCH79_00020559 [Gambusia affinis]